MNVSILGTEYAIVYKSAKEDPKLEKCAGYCDPSVHQIVIGIQEPNLFDMANMRANDQRIIRHELIHAFAFESGIAFDSDWAMNEEMTDWIARQFPKMLKAFSAASAI